MEKTTVPPLGLPATLLAAGLAASTLGLTGCAPTLPPPFPNLQQTLGPGWTMVPLPNSALEPGAVLQVTAPDGSPVTDTSKLQLRWLGTLTDCGVPETALQVTAATVPAITSNSTFSLDASIAAKAAGVNLGSLGANLASNANLTIASSTDRSMNYLRFSSWVNDPANRESVTRSCGPILSQPNVFIVEEAFVITSGNYNFTKSDGGSIAVSPPNIPVGGSASVTLSSTGSLTINADTVFALKTLQQVPAGAFQIANLVPPPTRMHGASHGAVRSLSLRATPAVSFAPMPVSISGKEITVVTNAPPPK